MINETNDSLTWQQHGTEQVSTLGMHSLFKTWEGRHM